MAICQHSTIPNYKIAGITVNVINNIIDNILYLELIQL